MGKKWGENTANKNSHVKANKQTHFCLRLSQSHVESQKCIAGSFTQGWWEASRFHCGFWEMEI